MPLNVFYTMVQKSQKWPKTQIKGGGPVLVHSSSLRLSDQYRKCHGWLLFFAFPALQPDCPAASCTTTSAETAKCETVATSGLGKRLLKTRWFVDDEGLSLRTITRRLPCVFFSFGPWIAAHDSCQSRRWSMVLLRSISPTQGSQVFILVFDVPSPKWVAQLGDRHSGRADNLVLVKFGFSALSVPRFFGVWCSI